MKKDISYMQRKDWLLLIFLLLNYCDFFMTAYGLQFDDIHELNPFYYMNPLLMNIIKIIFVPVGLILVHGRMEVRTYYFIIGIYAILIMNNTAMLLIIL